MEGVGTADTLPLGSALIQEALELGSHRTLIRGGSLTTHRPPVSLERNDADHLGPSLVFHSVLRKKEPIFRPRYEYDFHHLN